jgi:hypothetical protein
VRKQSRTMDRTATNVEVGVKKRKGLNSQCINQIGSYKNYWNKMRAIRVLEL